MSLLCTLECCVLFDTFRGELHLTPEAKKTQFSEPLHSQLEVAQPRINRVGSDGRPWLKGIPIWVRLFN